MAPTRVLGLGCLLLFWSAPLQSKEDASTPPQVLTSVAAVKNLARSQAARAVPVNIRGCITRVESWGGVWFQDDSAGIYIGADAEAVQGLTKDSEVIIQGVTGEGGYAPVIVKPKFTFIAIKSAVSRTVLAQELVDDKYENQLVQVRGIVRRVRRTRDDGLDFEIGAGLMRFSATILAQPGDLPEQLIDSEVQITGICRARYNAQGQFLGPELFLAALTDLVVEKPAPGSPFLLPNRQINSVMRFGNDGAMGHRVRVEGIVLHVNADSIYLRGKTGALRAELSKSTSARRGDRVMVVGFPSPGKATPYLESSLVQRVGGGEQLEPIPVSIRSLLTGTNEADLVQTRALLLDQSHSAEYDLFTLRQSNVVFNARLARTPHTKPAVIPNFSEVELQGICRAHDVVEVDSVYVPRSVELLLPSSGEIRVTKAAPWWTAKRALWGIGIIAFLSVSAMAWGLSARNKKLKREIDERHRAEEALRRSEEMLSDLFENAPIGVSLLGSDGQLLRVNRAERALLQLQPDEHIQRSAAEFFADKDKANDFLEHLARGEGVHNYEATLRANDGSIRNVRIESSVRRLNGEVLHTRCFTLDETERNRAEEQRRKMEVELRHAQKMQSIGQLAAGIAHEINTPIQFIGDNSRFLRDSFDGLLMFVKLQLEFLNAVHSGDSSDEIHQRTRSAADAADLEYLSTEIPQAIEQTLQGVERVAKIVLAMKEFSHPGSESMTRIDLNRSIESTLTVCRSEWKYVADVVTNFDPALPAVECLPGDLNQSLLNIVVNAAHAIGDVAGDGSAGKGTITVTTRNDGDWVEVRIQDTGTGIPERVRERIFEPFFTTKEVGKGTGQRLAIAYTIIAEKHHGSLRFETAVGKGTTFIVRLPVSQTPATAGNVGGALTGASKNP